jgi:hypothetical protein
MTPVAVIGWATVVAIALGLPALLIIALAWLVHSTHSRKLRMGVFIERDVHSVPDRDKDEGKVEDTLVDKTEWPTRHD